MILVCEKKIELLIRMWTTLMPEWVRHLVQHFGVYLITFAIGYVLISKIRSLPHLAEAPGFLGGFSRFLVFGSRPSQYTSVSKDVEHPPALNSESIVVRALKLSFCTFGLLFSYLLWGVLQERIMTTTYADGRFESSTFLVFGNRFLAFIVASIALQFTPQPPFTPPFYMFSFTSISNVVSSFCQLESLKYISFPVQVLSKSSKMCFVLISGTIISGKKYPLYDYLVALVMALGICLFVFGKSSSKTESGVTTMSGVVLILGYLIFDSFTSQWQGHLFSKYKLSSYQMMFGVNAFSLFFTSVSLLLGGEMFESLSRVLGDPILFKDIISFSFCGAMGQMFIFYTIKTFDAIVFTMIMTSKQLFAVILSIVLYGHFTSSASAFGIMTVFSGVLYRIYRQHGEKSRRPTSK